MEGLVELGRLGAIVPKTITAQPRAGNRALAHDRNRRWHAQLDRLGQRRHRQPSWRITCRIWPACATPIVVSIAGHDLDEFVAMAARLDGRAGRGRAGTEHFVPERERRSRFWHRSGRCAARRGRGRARACRLPVLAKLTPNVTDIASIAQAAADGGADAISAINTCLGMAVDWRRRRPLLGNGMGGLSGPAIKPIALRAVYQIARAVTIPVVGIGGIATIDDVMEFIVAGASAVQIGTANFYNPTATMTILDALPGAIAELGATSVGPLVGTLQSPAAAVDDSAVLATERTSAVTRRRSARKPLSTKHPHEIRSAMRVLSGIQPTGRPHWGNYFGAIRQYIDLQDEDASYYFIANLHALTTVRDAELLRQYTLDAAIDLLGAGARSDAGHAVRAIGRARGLGAVLDAADRHADGPARAPPRLQGQEGQGTAGRRGPVHVSGVDGGRHPGLRLRHGAGRRRPVAAHRSLPRSGGQLQSSLRPGVRDAQGQDSRRLGQSARHRRREDVEELQQHAGDLRRPQGAAQEDHADHDRFAADGPAEGSAGGSPVSTVFAGGQPGRARGDGRPLSPRRIRLRRSEKGPGRRRPNGILPSRDATSAAGRRSRSASSAILADGAVRAARRPPRC